MNVEPMRKMKPEDKLNGKVRIVCFCRYLVLALIGTLIFEWWLRIR